MSRIPALFGSMVFGDAVMKERLPAETYRDMKDAIRENRSLDRSVADIVANAMKDWAVEKGATHYTHWFQPLTGITAEKHDSFISHLIEQLSDNLNLDSNRIHHHSPSV